MDNAPLGATPVATDDDDDDDEDPGSPVALDDAVAPAPLDVAV